MISTARSLGGLTSTSEPIRFEVSSAEELGSRLSPPIADGSIDIITAATAAHWFDMDGFWPRAAEVLKPGGTVACWTGSTMRVHPSVPNAADIQVAVDKMFFDHLEAYTVAGNRIGRDLYANLPLPWTINKPVPEFDESTFFRKEWNKGGDLPEGEEFFMGDRTVDLDQLEKALSTASPVTRWREAHPEAVGTEQDILRLLRRQIEKLLREAGVDPGTEIVKGGFAGVLLMIKKQA
ncbi:putative methyltransferase domain-containing protein [Phaeoacremonium minimum UCRPA7]|uniref:Putative methyltransferase domain-containing protein n=1 Tax=Phaeoacremonium minimum (strain UCR-PA7) TaxID=1286976 RepID=R8BL47_PHAM7|nr:putative methyltransferase domain-containing protein [Phaeoacremonium minimum UCRPA7]EOO00131.1 putative methyltransferase domain-containing protein [Phaeoacremonium minimum UCRPA7]